MKLIFFFWWIPLQLHSQVQGKVVFDRVMFNPDKPNDSLKISSIVWYQGRQSIQEVPYLDANKDSTGTSTKTYVKYYLFIDPDLHQYFYYKCFSDTSRLVKHFKGVNNFEIYGGWDLYSNKKFEYDISKKLIDTVINGSNYSRYRFRKVKNGKTNDFILYVLCSKREVPIKYLKPFSEKIGCPVVRMDTYFEGRLLGITQLQYISDCLTNEEKRVFQAWKKNVNLYR